MTEPLRRAAILAHGLTILHAELHPADGGPAAILWCNARISAAPFYRKHGWRPVGDTFDIPPFGPHVVMRWAPA